MFSFLSSLLRVFLRVISMWQANFIAIDVILTLFPHTWRGLASIYIYIYSNLDITGNFIFSADWRLSV